MHTGHFRHQAHTGRAICPPHSEAGHAPACLICVGLVRWRSRLSSIAGRLSRTGSINPSAMQAGKLKERPRQHAEALGDAIARNLRRVRRRHRLCNRLRRPRTSGPRLVAVLQSVAMPISGDKAAPFLGAYGRAAPDVGVFKEADEVLARAHTAGRNPDWAQLLLAQRHVGSARRSRARRAANYRAALRIKPGRAVSPCRTTVCLWRSAGSREGGGSSFAAPPKILRPIPRYAQEPCPRARASRGRFSEAEEDARPGPPGTGGRGSRRGVFAHGTPSRTAFGGAPRSARRPPAAETTRPPQAAGKKQLKKNPGPRPACRVMRSSPALDFISAPCF